MFCHWRRKVFNTGGVGGGDLSIDRQDYRGGGGHKPFSKLLGGGGGWPLLPRPLPCCSYAYCCGINIHSSVPIPQLQSHGTASHRFACSVENISIVLFPVSVRK